MKWHNPFFFFVIVRSKYEPLAASKAWRDVTISSFSFIKTRIKQEAK